MDTQEAFDTIARHLFAQGRASVKNRPGAGAMCAYRGAGGLRCAVGVLIADEDYRIEFDALGADGNTAIGRLIGRHAQGAYGENPSLDRLAFMSDAFLTDMQDAHDDAMPYPAAFGASESEGKSIGNWVEAMRGYARDWNLSADVLDEVCIPTDLESRLL